MRDLGIDLDIKTRLNDLVKYKSVPFPACLKTELRRSTETLILTTCLFKTGVNLENGIPSTIIKL
jgi:hypothetical protein